MAILKLESSVTEIHIDAKSSTNGLTEVSQSLMSKKSEENVLSCNFYFKGSKYTCC